MNYDRRLRGTQKWEIRTFMYILIYRRHARINEYIRSRKWEQEIGKCGENLSRATHH